MRDPPVALARLGVAQGYGCDGDGGFARRDIAGVRCSMGSRDYDLWERAQKVQEIRQWLTEGLFRAELQRRCVDGEVGRRRSALSSEAG